MTDFDAITQPVEQRITAGLLRLGTALRAQAWVAAAAAKLTPTQMELLALTAARTHPVKLRDLAEQTALTSATVSDAVSSLQHKGLVEKGRAADDARALAIQLTSAGKALAEQIGGWPDFLAAAMGVLAEEEKTVLLNVIIKLIRELQEREQIPISRMCVTCRHFQPYRHAGEDRPHHCALVDAPFGGQHLRIDCPEHEAAGPAVAAENWRRLQSRRPQS